MGNENMTGNIKEPSKWTIRVQLWKIKILTSELGLKEKSIPAISARGKCNSFG